MNYSKMSKVQRLNVYRVREISRALRYSPGPTEKWHIRLTLYATEKLWDRFQLT